MILSLFDLRDMKIPAVLLAVGSGGAVLEKLYIVWEQPTRWQWTVITVCLAVLPGTVMLVLAGFSQKSGIGDGWALLNMGMLENYKICVFLWGISLAIMALFSVGLLVLHKAHKNTRIPYMPFLTIAYVIRLILV